ncbi:hypothetical protein K458DRAFT_381512 [Lentithecium fluviatile CBS 122367]|uniref:Uncharacterized protein n=1 Tax=Lentithecium fluviatile CBS 122367 TaxID=1168545 RepID=A0A6G1JND9_9PLEO|nr:hypothetical protein K458DRAFT_381512 [Lentithecium fluviatile CBS 122367]
MATAYGGVRVSTYREQVERLERGGVNTIGKEHFTYLYSPARGKALTPKNIKAGFAATGLFPINPERVLRTMPKPPAELTVSQVNQARPPQDGVVQSPVTPVSAEGLMSLQNLIIKQDAHALDETRKQSLQRHLQKFAKAAQLSFAKGALQQNQIRLLMAINNEAKVRRATKSVVLGTAKVMSYEDLEEARAKRAEQDAAKEAKGKSKRSRKRKNATPETVEDTVDKTKRGRKRKNAASDAEAGVEAELKAKMVRISEAPEPWRAPVAQMW